MEIGLAVGGAFLSSALNVLFDRLAPKGDLLKMFQRHTNDVRLLKKLRMTLLGLQAVLSDAENKQPSNRSVSEWLNELRDAVDSAENLMEEVNYEALRLKVEGQHQNLAETSNQQVSDLNLCLSDDFLLNIKGKLEETIETLEVLEKQIGRLGLKEHFGSTKQETRKPSTSLVDETDVFGRQNEIEDLIDRLLSKDANGKNLTVVPIVGMGGVGKTTLAKAVYNDEKVKDHFGLKAWFCVSEAYGAELFTSQLQGMKQIVELCIRNCNSLTSLPFIILPTTLKRIEIYGCRKLKLEAPVGELFLEYLRLEGCDSIDDISCEFVPRARTLCVESCHNFTRFLIPTGTEGLTIISCENVEILSVECGTQMTSLHINHCKKLKRLPEHMQELLPSLKNLEVKYCPEIESFPEGGLPFNLQVLEIWSCQKLKRLPERIPSLNRLKLCNCPEIDSFPEGGLPFHFQKLQIGSCKKLVNNRKEWRLERFPCLRELFIYHNGSDEEIVAGENWELPCSIQHLGVSNLKTLSSQVLKSLTSLEFLNIWNLPQIQSLVEEGLPSSLSEQCLSNHAELHPLPSKGLQHLTSLRRLVIYSCHNLHSLAELELPSSLSQLSIWFCLNLHSLPLKGMPSSLSKLWIRNCPLLKAVLEFDKGEYWPKIASISTILIDWEECL